MEILVLYYSKSGNTRKLAESVSVGIEIVEGVTANLKNTDDVTKDDFVSCQGIIAGSPVYFGSMAAQLKYIFEDYVGLRKKMEGKIGAAFTSSGNPTGGKETTLMSIIQALLIYGIIIVGDPMSATGHYGLGCVGTPDEQSKEIGQKLGQRVAQLVKKVFA